MMKNKKLIIAVAAVVAVIALMLGIYFATRPEAQEGAKTITVVVVHKDGTEKTFTCHTDAENLAEVLLAEELVTGSEGQYGLTIESVDGETADWTVDGAYWSLYIGEKYATTGASDTLITDGGVYKLVYTVYVSE